MLASQKCYFLVFYKGGKTAIVLWRGQDQSTLPDFKSAIHQFKQTKFRLVKNGLRAKGVRSQSNLQDVQKFLSKPNLGSLAGDGGDDPPSFEDMGKSSSLFEIKGNSGLDMSLMKQRKSNADDKSMDKK